MDTNRKRRLPSEEQRDWIGQVLEFPVPSTREACDTFITFILQGTGKPDEMPETRIRQLRKFFRTYYRARVRLRRGAFGGRIGEVIGLCVRSKAEIEKVREKYGQPPSLYTLLVDLYPGDEKRTRVAPSNVKVLISGEEARLF